MLIRQSKRSREATHGFLAYTDRDRKIDHPHLAPPGLARLRESDRPRPLRSRLRDDDGPRSKPSP